MSEEIRLVGNVLHVGESMINIPMSLKYKDLSENEWKLFFECVLEQQDQLAKARQRIDELESQLQLTALTTHEASFESDYGKKRLNKFAIEKKIEGAFLFADYLDKSNFSAAIAAKESGFFQLVETFTEQLRKE